MPENETPREFPKCFRSPEAVRLLWEGTRKAIEGGIDTVDLVSLCDIIVRLADHRLLLLTTKYTPSPEGAEAADQLQHYRKMASDLLQWAAAPVPEPAWAVVAERLKSAGAAPLEFQDQPR